MMNKSHATQALCGVVVAGTFISAINFPVAANIGVFAVSAALMVSGGGYPDIDSEGSHPTRSYGWLSHLLHSFTHLLTQAFYNATLGAKDRKKKGSHRLLTHTAIGNVLAGLTLIGLGYIHQWVAAISVGFLIGMAITMWKRKYRWVALAGGIAIAYATYDPNWLWLWGLAFALGNMIHCFGDSCTLSGTPWFWPMERNGKRWGASHALPEHLRIRTGTAHERVLMLITFLLTGLLVGAILLIKYLV